MKGYFIEDLHKFAESKGDGSKYLSNEYISSKTKYEWKCGICGNDWEAVWNSVYARKWCPNCARENRAIKHRKYSIEDLHEYTEAKGDGSKCLAEE